MNYDIGVVPASSPGALIAFSCAKYFCVYDVGCRARQEDEGFSRNKKQSERLGTRMGVAPLPTISRRATWTILGARDKIFSPPPPRRKGTHFVFLLAIIAKESKQYIIKGDI